MLAGDQNLRIPQEVYAFFTNPGGHSLIMRGHAGTGKTTLALQVIEDLAAIEKSYYFSTRVSDESLFIHFPWLKGKLVQDRKASGEGIVEDKLRREGLSALKGVASGRPRMDKGKMSLSIGKDLGEIEDLYSTIEGRLPERTLLVIDSLDALCERYGVGDLKLISAFQRDIVEGYGCSILYVLESPEQQLDYLGDGVIVLDMDQHEGRRTRVIDILKLRGCEIRQPKYLYSLRGGKVQSFDYRWEKVVAGGQSFSPILDHSDKVSCGTADLDALMMGGLEKGSVVLLELGAGVPTSVAGEIENALVANFITQNRGAVWVPVRKASAESARNRILRGVPSERFDKCVRIPELASAMDQPSGPYIMPVEGTSAASDLKWANLTYYLQGTEAPLLSLIGFDAMESTYGSQVMEQLTDHLAAVRRNKGIFVGITSISTSSTLRLADLATVHLKVGRIGGTVVIFGEEPYTECNAVTFREQEKGGRICLTPIV
jgi:KaiC/GvpD/RAD55 family RecA-like ATPase